jgi:hypothetical protein
MKRTKRLGHNAQGACAAAILLVASSMAMAKDPEPPRNGCAAVTKTEYDSAKKQHLLNARFGNYLRTGRPLRRVYWYCA